MIDNSRTVNNPSDAENYMFAYETFSDTIHI